MWCRRASRVDVKKLEKQEAKLKAKIEKRARRDLYEGSKLLEQAKKQVRLRFLLLSACFLTSPDPKQSYEEMFMQV